ncbi:hypothetical protein ACFT1A_26555 [Rhodococcus sp. NPDC057135]|uniref:hypothetical protein n=1 Tax=Rhodococcus sp. NPDC057135 TaxID=3346028 RepID=UPI0036432804
MGGDFEAKTIRAKRCSDECKKIAARKRATDHYSANGRVGDYGSTDCCIFEQHFTRTRWKQKICSDVCRAINRKWLARNWYEENTELANQRSSVWSLENYDYEPAKVRREERERTAQARKAQRKEYDRLKSKEWRERNKERAAELKIVAKQRNPEKYRETHQQWREANKERRAELNRRWAETNPD